MFWGSYDQVLDDKSRTSLPKDLRDRIAKPKGDLWITAFDKCLAILSDAEFEAHSQRLLTSRNADSAAIQRLKRLFIGMAQPCNVDKQGRFLVPPKLREWAHLEREIVLSGVGERIEIWDRTRHAQELEDARLNFEDDSRQMNRETAERE
jgi:MraZ protein